MRRKDKEITDPGIIRQIIEQSNLVRLALHDTPAPYIVPLHYGYKDNILYMHSAPSGRKIDLLRSNNTVGFAIELPYEIIKGEKTCGWSTQYRSMMGVGRVDIVHETSDKIAGLQCIMQQCGGGCPDEFNEKNLDAMVVLKLVIEQITGKQSGDW
jgi:uncharacterized protein